MARYTLREPFLWPVAPEVGSRLVMSTQLCFACKLMFAILAPLFKIWKILYWERK